MSVSSYNSLSNGYYTLNDDTSDLTVYCSFDYSRNYSWTLIETFTYNSQIFNLNPQIQKEAFYQDAPGYLNNIQSNINHLWRMSKAWMELVNDNSQYLLATCNLNTNLQCHLRYILQINPQRYQVMCHQ